MLTKVAVAINLLMGQVTRGENYNCATSAGTCGHVEIPGIHGGGFDSRYGQHKKLLQLD